MIYEKAHFTVRRIQYSLARDSWGLCVLPGSGGTVRLSSLPAVIPLALWKFY